MTRLTSAMRHFPGVNIGGFCRAGFGTVDDGDTFVDVLSLFGVMCG